MGLERNVEKLLLDQYDSEKSLNPYVRGPKIIHEPLYGTFEYKEPEVAVLDSSPIQRLKYIHQLGLSYQIFPGARHTRFEHTIGVVNIASKFLRLLNKKGYLAVSDINTVRLSACLHDIGHGPFSHISENVMKIFPEMTEELNDEQFSNCKPHEILSYHIIKTKLFRDFLEDIQHRYNYDFDVDEIANYIIGIPQEPEENQYKADLINGEFDSDKLDYITRDGYFSGLPISVDVDRLLFSVDVGRTPDGKKKIIMSPKGVGSLQQLLFDKVMLNSTVYHHHKLKAIDQMIQLAFEIIIDHEIPLNGITLKSPADLLKFDDYQILTLKTSHEKLNELISSLKKRHLFKRALVISPKTIEEEKKENLKDFIKLEERPEKIADLRKILAERIRGGCTEYDIAIEIPSHPALREASQEIIKFGEDDYRPSSDVFPAGGWLQVFSAHQWKAWIFSSERFKKDAQKRGIELFEEVFDLSFNEEAVKQCKF